MYINDIPNNDILMRHGPCNTTRKTTTIFNLKNIKQST